MEIRLMNIEDYDAVYKLWTNTAGMGLRNLDDSLNGIAKFLKRNPSTSFVALIDNELVGVILCGHDGRRGYIYHTAVKQDFRKKGIGKALVNTALNAFKIPLRKLLYFFVQWLAITNMTKCNIYE